MRPIYTEGSSSFVTSTAASVATGRSEQVPGRDSHPLWTSAFHGALEPATYAQLVGVPGSGEPEQSNARLCRLLIDQCAIPKAECV